MGRITLIGRLALRDLRRRRTEAVLLLLAILSATTTLTLGLVLRDAAEDPYQATREATRGPDVVAAAGSPDALSGLVAADGVTGSSGPFPVVAAELQTPDRTSDVQVVGRDAAATAIDQPEVREGQWVRNGGVVVEAAFAESSGIRVGDRVTLDGRSLEVVGIAVTAALAPYPATTCLMACLHGDPDTADAPKDVLANPGLVWLTRDDVRALTTEPAAYVLNLGLADPNGAAAFVGAQGADGPMLRTWQDIRTEATELAGDIRILLLIGAWLLGLLAVASLAVLVGGRMADQTRRVGLLKAVGGTPGLVTAVLLAEYALVALVAAAAGLTLGTLTAPLLTEPGAGLLGSAGTPSLTLSTIAIVTAVAVGVAGLATAVPATRAARSSTIDALADAARPPRRAGWAIVLSTRLPVPLLLAVRVAARRPRRVLLGVTTVAITVSGVFVALVLDAFLTSRPLVAGYDAAQVGQLRRVLLVVMALLACLAAVNAIVLTWATVLDNRHTSALARALGATPRDVTAALAAAQVLPAIAGAVVGIFPGGVVLFAAIMAATGGDGDRATYPSAWQLLAMVVITGLVVAALTAIPARLGGRRPVSQALRAEPA
ncbi:ABC transporter permease [Cryptosporangium minutisporangium]|uniref:ABC3 transporter permease C-terminal domain-containing protein n=1 Tax=Cryptosporangium minutisporangium TaxID=113569 RepID=A0ABP6TCJ7_9ACTN